jgi:hypothetical protein
VGDAHIFEAIGPGSLHTRACGFMKADRDVQLLTSRPQRIVIRVVPRPVVVDVWTQEDRLHPELRHGPARLGHGSIDIMGRDGGGPEHPLGIGGLNVVG